MLAYSTPAAHYSQTWPTSELPHGTCNPPSYHVANGKTTSENDSTLSRYSSSVQPWAKSQLPSARSFTPSSPGRAEQSGNTGLHARRSPSDHTPVHLSPFRSVQRMKQPFQLRLPSSPTRKERKASPLSPKPMPLRKWRSDQNLRTTSLEAFGIRPDSPRSDSRVSKSSPSSPHFPHSGDLYSANDNDASNGHDFKHADKPCAGSVAPRAEALMGEGQSLREMINTQTPHSNFDNPNECDEPQSVHASINTDHTLPPSDIALSERTEKGDARDLSTDTQCASVVTASNDRSWIPNNFLYCETWLQGVPEAMDSQNRKSKEGFANRRKFQIVQKSPPASEESFAVMTPDEPVRFAVASKTKPKLVDISPKQSPVISASDTDSSTTPVQSTPDQHQHEVSAFSPNTPSERVDSGYGVHYPYDASGSIADYDDVYSVPGSMDPERTSPNVVCRTSSQSHDSCVAAEKPVNQTTTPSQNVHISSPIAPSMSERKQLEKWWDFEWTLEQLELSVKNFPGNMLQLTSPVIMFLRQNNEKALIRPFRKIFPGVAEHLLDCLCAALIAHNYIMSMSSSRKSTSFHFDFVPKKASATLGIQIFDGSLAHLREKDLSSRSVELHKDLDMIVNYLLFATCGRTDETLKSAVLVLAQILEAKA